MAVNVKIVEKLVKDKLKRMKEDLTKNSSLKSFILKERIKNV